MLNWQKKRPKQWSTKLNWPSELQIGWPKQWSVQGSDHKDKRSRRLQIWRLKLTWGYVEASPCCFPTIHRDRWTHWLAINLNFINIYKHVERTAFQKNWIVFWQLAFRAWKVLGTFNKQVPGSKENAMAAESNLTWSLVFRARAEI